MKALKEIKNRADNLGFDLCSAAPAMIPEKDRASYLAWIGNGSAAEMDYMKREPEKRLNVDRAFPGMKTVLSLGVSYFQGPFPPKPGSAYGRVARYAWGLDYHEILRTRLEMFLGDLSDILGSSVKTHIAVDTKPLLERSLANASGLGFIGKNTVLISPKLNFHVGSWIFLAEILLDVPFEGDTSPINLDGCGGCTKCLNSCPTNAFEGPYKLKSDRCISYLTIENKGWIPLEMRSSISDWLYGCDVCQDVCPFNARAKETRWPEFQADKGVGAWMSLRDIFSWTDPAVFKQKWGHTPLVRAKRRGLVRNACVVAGNSKDESLIGDLLPLLDDDEAIVRGHALWALSQLKSKTAREKAEPLLKKETDAQVRIECEALL